MTSSGWVAFCAVLLYSKSRCVAVAVDGLAAAVLMVSAANPTAKGTALPLQCDKYDQGASRPGLEQISIKIKPFMTMTSQFNHDDMMTNYTYVHSNVSLLCTYIFPHKSASWYVQSLCRCSYIMLYVSRSVLVRPLWYVDTCMRPATITLVAKAVANEAG